MWKPQRKQLSMSFSNQICWSYLPIFNQKADIFVRNVSEHVGKGDFDMLKYSAACTLDLTLETVLGTSMNIQKGKNMHYMKALTDWLSVVSRRMVNVFLHPDIIYKQTQLYQMECDALARSEAMQEELILKKMKEFEENNHNNNDLDEANEDKPYEKPQIFIERLIKLRNQGIITDQEIRDQVHLIIFAGQDTSSYTIAMTLLLLAMHPKIEQRVIDELNTVFGDLPVDCDLTMEHLNALTYLEQVIKETLRVYPVAPLLLRHCTEDTKLPNFVIPKNTEVVISVFTGHRRKDVWGEDADDFNPDHFSKEVSSKRNPFAFMAFSNGPRDCLGRRFAFISIKTILAKLLRKYRFSTHLGKEDLKFQLEVTNKPINGIVLEAEERI
ncbi:cytochrome P450 4c3-like [Contarinia nasturtii]|uniref:cytochrome P450 4c3-like n=1 Tax=Contarinia nasturtii TaxID=265458 RepID=UPI0012D4740B|nr:cytochrome P450 4c3-like [Contarinia nasturtii]